MTQSITPTELQHRIAQGHRLQLVDVRSAGEFASGHVPMAINLPMEQVEARLDDLPQTEPIVLICQSGQRACMTEVLLKPHRADLLVLDGGTEGWESAALPLVRSTVARWSLERQVRFGAGLLVLTGSVLTLTVSPLWALLPLAVGGGLVFAGVTNICGLAALLGVMPWNKPRPASMPTPEGAKR